jgi:hypothetical protein
VGRYKSPRPVWLGVLAPIREEEATSTGRLFFSCTKAYSPKCLGLDFSHLRVKEIAMPHTPMHSK